ncbi:MAG: tRNA pseudouridine(55) synthase TruB [Clostridiales bacterium]|nr:tRNA pseudouridine(55) synthase TruB [Clostridiales bacterium]
MQGFINVIKESGMTSFDVVNKVKRKFKIPCGHMGTLDPMASGVLAVGLGKTTRLFNYLLDKVKVYVADFEFGYETDTLDITGKVLKENKIEVNKEDIVKALPSFIGEIDQIPPKYSAKNINGKRGYELAREGVEFTLASKKVTILDFKLIEKINDTTYRFEITCKGGTYIRSLARDLGYKLGTFGTMVSLDRRKAGIFTYDNAITIKELMETPIEELKIIPADEAVDYTKVLLGRRVAERLLNGINEKYPYPDGIYRVYSKTEFIGIGEAKNYDFKIKAYVKD